MKQISLWLFSAALILLSACSKERPDLSGLLKTVPSSAAAVAGIHLKSLYEDAGCKVNGNEIKPGKEISSIFEKMPETDKNEIMSLFRGDSGIVPDCAVAFLDANRSYITMSLYDTEKFKNFIKNETGKEFSSQGDGVEICDNVAIKGAQVWISLKPKRIDADVISSFSTLSESQSFISTDMAKIILESDDDIIGWGKFNSLTSLLMNRKDMGMLSIASGLFFEDVDALTFSLDFEDGEMEASVKFLDEKGKPTKYLLPADKIDINTVKSIEGTCDGLLAFTLTPKMIQKFEKIGSAIGGSLFNNFSESLKNIDGTVAFALGEGGESMSGVVTTTGEVSRDINNLLSMGGISFSQDGKILRLSRGTTMGGISVDECADNLKGYCFGIVIDMKTLQKTAGGPSSFMTSLSNLTLGLEPKSGSIELKLNVKTVDPKENFLISLIKEIQ